MVNRNVSDTILQVGLCRTKRQVLPRYGSLGSFGNGYENMG